VESVRVANKGLRKEEEFEIGEDAKLMEHRIIEVTKCQ
jgi:hypothetical protein